MKFLYVLITLLLSFQSGIKSNHTIGFNDLQWKGNCDLYWREHNSSWEECYDRHLSAKGGLIFLATR
jgi:hypothetical protein